MLFGICGAHRTGKSTLAKLVADDLGIVYQPTSITESARRHGFDPVAPMLLADRVALQYHLLDDHIEMIKANKAPMIVDRTPIDMLGYLFCEVDMQSHHKAPMELLDKIELYRHMAIDATRTYYDFLFVLGQLPNYQVEPNKPAPNRAYQSHAQLVMEGAVATLSRKTSYATLYNTSLDARRTFVHDTIVQRLDEADKLRRSSPHVH